jgi:hypothetical protein
VDTAMTQGSRHTDTVGCKPLVARCSSDPA